MAAAPEVRGISNAVSDEIQRADDEHDCDTRSDGLPSGGSEIAEIRGKHPPPCRSGWLDSQAKDGQGAHCKQATRDRIGRRHRKGGNDLRTNVGPDDLSPGGAEQLGHFDVLALRKAERRSAANSKEAWRESHADRNERLL